MVGPGVANQRWREAAGWVDGGAGERDGHEADVDGGEADGEGGQVEVAPVRLPLAGRAFSLHPSPERSALKRR